MDLRGLPKESNVELNGMPLESAVYAVVESGVFDSDEASVELSEIFVPITKEIGGLTNNAVSHLKFYLADIDAIVGPIAVIPDIGGPPNAYFMVKERETWRTDFMKFLESEIDLEAMISSSDESTD